MGREGLPPSSDEIVAALQAGERPGESDLVRQLASHGCPKELVEGLSQCRWVLPLRRVLSLMLRHPACPRAFAWQALPRVGWNDLLQVCRDPRTAPSILRQAERKLGERVRQITSGERIALARRAPRGVFPKLLGDEDPGCVRALIDNPQFTESDALRLLHVNRFPDCTLVLLRHERWGSVLSVRAAAARSSRVPLGVALGLIAALPARELAVLAKTETIRPAIRAAADDLLDRRGERQPS